MIYSIGFKTDGVLHSFKGQKYMHVDGNAGAFLKELCGKYPSAWDMVPAAGMELIFDHALKNLLENRKEYEYFSDGGFSTPEEIIIVLNELIARCKAFPNAILEVDW